MTHLLEINNLSVSYGANTAVDDITFSIKHGEIFGLLGPNGAGKTSTLSAIEGLLKPTSGSIIVGGYDAKVQPLYARANLGVQLQSTSFQPELTVVEILQLFAGIYGQKLNKAELNTI